MKHFNVLVFLLLAVLCVNVFAKGEWQRGPATESRPMYDANMQHYLPQDMAYTSQTDNNWVCDENGRPSQPVNNGNTGRCSKIVSPSTKRTFLLRLSHGGDSAFAIKSGGALVKWVAFGGGTHAGDVLYASPEATQFRLANGGGSSGATASAPRQIDCSSSYIGISDRLACAHGAPGAQTGKGAARAQQEPASQSAADVVEKGRDLINKGAGVFSNLLGK